ncbi:TATA box-binding protein-associated factor RNA polymerase I subunit B [Acorus calamus]|uniref:TATA box-binding protein-associated factor RNA polymerase I subunit B n=1 Tax=Acorus calamus TaxID=4465 RepID=A0AAV9CK87_ACOCL|nr:TATA box-binding protein-associated factor RNA polymerase I subunit B [Acorus calamus]
MTIYCDACGGSELDSGGDGFYYCRLCGSQSQDIVDTAPDDTNILAGGGGIYSLSQRRHPPAVASAVPSQTPAPPLPVNRGAVDTPYGFEDRPSVPLDFGDGGGGSVLEPEVIADGIRTRYVRGLQLMIQLQCEALVDRHGVSPSICGITGTVWLRFLAETKVLSDDWSNEAFESSEVVGLRYYSQEQKEQKVSKRRRSRKHRSIPRNLYGRRAADIWLESLKKTVPLSTSLAVCFLACHVARGPVLATDFSKWVLEEKLPYLSLFIEFDKDRYLGRPSKACPFSTSRMFRPKTGVGSWKLEATAGSIARRIGLRLPPVNFHGIARRYLERLPVPVEKVLAYACGIYEWSMPPDLWLSANECRLPTWVGVMSVIIVAIRILYKIHGQGIWEKSFACSSGLKKSKPASKVEEVDGNDKECRLEFDTVELFHNLEALYEKTDDLPDFSRDLASYLKYCKDVIFAGMTTSFEEEELIRTLRTIYEKHEPEKESIDGALKSKGIDGSMKSPEDGCGNLDQVRRINELENGRKSGNETLDGDQPTLEMNRVDNNDFEVAQEKPSFMPEAEESIALKRLKLDMEQNMFQYLLPRRAMKSKGYLHYERKVKNCEFTYVAHADYYVLLRACAKLAHVEPRIQHISVSKLERRLDWIERRIRGSLVTLREPLHQRGG